jgi:hypothetical protein
MEMIIRSVKFKFDFDWGHSTNGGEYHFTYESALILNDMLDLLSKHDSRVGAINKPE